MAEEFLLLAEDVDDTSKFEKAEEDGFILLAESDGGGEPSGDFSNYVRVWRGRRR